MDNIQQIILTIGIIFLSAYSMKVSQEALSVMNQMNHQVQMMFLKN